MRHTTSIAIVLFFVLASFAPAMTASGGSQAPTVEWRVTLAAKPYPGEPTTPQVVDLDNDGTNEIVLTCGDSLYVLRSKGMTKWRYTIEGTITAATSANIDANPDKEIIAVSESGTVHALSRDGSHLWGVETGSAIRGAPAFADMDSNGRLEIYVGTMKGEVYILDDKGTLIKKADIGGPIMQPLITRQINVPDHIAIIAATQDPAVIGLDNNLTTVWNFPLDSTPSGAMALGDIDADGKLEAMVATSSTLYAIWGTNGTLKWKSDLQTAGGLSSPALADIDMDAMTETIIGNGGTDILQFFSDGGQGWQATLGNKVAGISLAQVPDFAVLAITVQGHLESRDQYGLKLWHKELGFQVNRSVTVADLDKDSEAEILAVGTGGEVVLLNTHQPINSAWPMAGHDTRNTRDLLASENGNLLFSQRWASEPQMGWGGVTIVADIDADGKDELYVVSDYGALSVVRGDGRIGEQMTLSENILTIPLAAELNGDGGKELVIGTVKEVQARSKLLTQIWNYSMPELWCLAAGDVNGDNLSEVFAANGSGRIVALQPMDGVKIWADNEGRGITSLTIADLGSDGIYELIEATQSDTATIRVRNATDGAARWSSDSYVYDIKNPAVGDLDGDSKMDLVFGVLTGDVVAFDWKGTKLWAITVPYPVQAVMAIDGNVTGQDVAVTLTNGDIMILDGNNGATLHTIKTDHVITVGMNSFSAYLGTSSPTFVGYTDYKSIPDEPTLFWSERTGSDAIETSLNGKGTSLTFGDLDGDGQVEMVHGASNMVAYSLGVGPGPTVPWSMWGHDPERTFNPFAKGGKIFPDLTIGSEDITFEPLVVNGNMTANVTIDYHNMGPIRTEGFNITLSRGPTKLATLQAQSLAPFSDGKATYKWAVGYENSTLDVVLDSSSELTELRENNNKASRTLFKNQHPVAEAGSSIKADPGQPIIFDSGPSKDPDGDIATYKWEFMDGTTGTGPVVAHVFTHSGTYIVELTVTDEYGATGTDNRTVLINHAPDFSNWSPKGNATMNEGERIDMWVITEDSDGDKVTLDWYMDDIKAGTGQSWSLWANYSSSGVHTVKASASDGSLVTNRTWKLTITESNRLIEDATPHSPVSIPEGSSQEFELKLALAAEGARIDWFLDGHRVLSNTSSFAIFTEAGTQGQHSLKVQVQDLNIWDFYEWEIKIGPRSEVPKIRWAYPEGEAVSTVFGTPVYFGLSSEGGTIQWYVNGMAQIAKNGPSYRFDTWGNRTYNVTATVSTSTGSISRNWTLLVEYPPMVNIDASALQIKTGQKVNFDGQKSKASWPTDAIQSYKWDMGDGYKTEGSQAKHTYKKAGSYQVTLTVTDTKGMSSSASVIIVVTPEDQVSTPGFEATILMIAAVLGAVVMIKRRNEI